MGSKNNGVLISGLHCKACDAPKNNITVELCSQCEYAALKSLPMALKIKAPAADDLLTAVKVMEAVEYFNDEFEKLEPIAA